MYTVCKFATQDTVELVEKMLVIFGKISDKKWNINGHSKIDVLRLLTPTTFTLSRHFISYITWDLMML